MTRRPEPLQQAIELCQTHSLFEQEARARNNLSVSMAIHFGDLEATRDHLNRARRIGPADWRSGQ